MKDKPKSAKVQQYISIPVPLANEILQDLYELRGERDWWKNEPRRRYAPEFKKLCKRINQLSEILALQS